MDEFNSVKKNTHAVEQVRTILGLTYYNGLSDLFASIIKDPIQSSTSANAQVYVSFVTRRCSCLFYLYLINMDKLRLSDDEMSRDVFDVRKGIRIMTETAFIDTGRLIGEKLCNEDVPISDMPSLVLVDDSVSYGRSLNNVLNTFRHEAKETIFAYVEQDHERQTYAIDRLGQYLRRKVSIRVYAEKEQTRLLQSNYREMLRSEKTFPIFQWNDYSIRLAELIRCADVANTAFVMSVGISEKKISSTSWEKKSWSYRDFTETLFYQPILSSDKHSLIAFASVRQIAGASGHPYRLIPFLFLPQMEQSSFETLEKTMFTRMYQEGIISKKYSEIQLQLSKKMTLTSRTNFVTTYLSHCLLVDAFPEVLEQPAEDWDDIKIQWNYCQQIVGTTPLSSILPNLRKADYRSSLLSVQEIQILLASTHGDKVITDNYRESFSEPTRKDMEKWNELFEEYLFELAIEIEASAHSMVVANFRPGESTLRNLHETRYRVLSDFMLGFDKFLQEKFPDEEIKLSTSEFIIIMLQMMDAGVMAVVSDENESKNGISHQVRICEQALATVPRRYYVHAELLDYLESHNWMRDTQKITLIQRYLQRISKNSVLSDEQIEKLTTEILNYRKQMENSAQKNSYWTVGINRHFKVNVEKQELVADTEEDKRRKIQSENARLFRQILNNK